MSVTGLRAFDVFFTPWRRRRLAAIRMAGLPPALPRGEPLVLVANHTSWWDGFLLREVHRVLRPGAHLSTIMLASELRRFPFFRYMGAEGMQPGSVASVRSLLHRLDTLRARDPELVVAYFPQGRIWPMDRRPLGFHPGIDRLVRRLAPATVLPLGLRVEPLNRVSPTAFVSAGPPIRVAAGQRIDAHALEAGQFNGRGASADLLLDIGANLQSHLVRETYGAQHAHRVVVQVDRFGHAQATLSEILYTVADIDELGRLIGRERQRQCVDRKVPAA